MGVGYRLITAQIRKRREDTCIMVVRRGERTRPSVRVTVSSGTRTISKGRKQARSGNVEWSYLRPNDQPQAMQASASIL